MREKSVFMDDLNPTSLYELYKKFVQGNPAILSDDFFYYDNFKIVDSGNKYFQLANSKICILILSKPLKIIDVEIRNISNPYYCKHLCEKNEDHFLKQLQMRLDYLNLRRKNEKCI